MSKNLKRLDLLFREVQDSVAQENFWRLKLFLDDLLDGTLTSTGTSGGGSGSSSVDYATVAGEAAATVKEFITDAGTPVGSFVRVVGTNTVQNITDNTYATIPYGIFGVVLSKPSPLIAKVAFVGIVSGYSGLTTGSPIFISTSGLPTHTAPTTGMSQEIGKAVSTTEIFINIKQYFRKT